MYGGVTGRMKMGQNHQPARVWGVNAIRQRVVRNNRKIKPWGKIVQTGTIRPTNQRNRNRKWGRNAVQRGKGHQPCNGNQSNTMRPGNGNKLTRNGKSQNNVGQQRERGATTKSTVRTSTGERNRWAVYSVKCVRRGRP